MRKTTQRLLINAAHIDSADARAVLAQAAALLRCGGTVAFPTETVYGLGANALDAAAVAAIFTAKQRPSWDPLIVHISDRAMLESVARDIPSLSQKLIDAFWPGPLTLLLPRTRAIPDAVTAGRDRVGVRMPSHPIAQALIAAAGVPIAAPSANRFGRTSPTAAAHVLEDLDGRIDAVIDGGPTQVGVESTVVDATTNQVICYRPGIITQANLEAITGPITMFTPPHDGAPPLAQPSPGVGLRHYAPRARLLLVEAEDPATLPGKLLRSLAERTAAGDVVGVMLPSGWHLSPGAWAVYPWGDWNNCAALAERVFAGMRELDAAGVTVILCPLPPAAGVCVAVRDRLSKAAR